MKYEEKYVAFLDVLGFSSFVKKENNIEIVSQLFDFINKLCYFFNSSPELLIQASFFSDSIVFISEKLGTLLIAISLAEGYVSNEMGLLFRGGISWGKTYMSNNMIFGPGLIDAYEIQKKAIYSRIIIHDSVKEDLSECLDAYSDIDGYRCVNPFSVCMHNQTSFGSEGASYPDGDPEQVILSIFSEERKKLIDKILQYYGNPVVEKYFWRIRPFNYTCQKLSDEPKLISMFHEMKYIPSNQFKEDLLSCQIDPSQLITLVSK